MQLLLTRRSSALDGDDSDAELSLLRDLLHLLSLYQHEQSYATSNLRTFFLSYCKPLGC